MADDLATRLAALAAPLQEERDRIEEESVTLQARLTALRADASRLDQILRRLNGTPAKAGRKKSTPHGAVTAPPEETLEIVRSYLRKWIHRDDFNAGGLATAIVSTKNPPITARETIRRAVLTLHDRGELQFVRSGQGGSRQYKWLGGDGNA